MIPKLPIQENVDRWKTTPKEGWRGDKTAAARGNLSFGLTKEPLGVTLCHMTTITIRQLHDETGRWIRKATALGELQVTDRGRVVAKLIPASAPTAIPYFATRKLLPSFRSAKLRGGRDSTIGIGEERERPLR